MIRAPRPSPAAAARAMAAATYGALAPRVCPTSASPPKVIAPPVIAPSAKVAQAIAVVLRLPAYPDGASVSTIETPHGDHAPVTPAAIAATITTALSI